MTKRIAKALTGMDTLHEPTVRVEISVAFKPELDAESEDIFAKEFLATFPTKHGCSTQAKDAKKREDISKIKSTPGLQNSTEKSPRQARRNARERGRKARLNAAFQVLRSMVTSDLDSTQEQKKLTQVEILRLAKNYISSLTTILQTCNDNFAVSYQDRSSLCGNFFANMK